MDVVGADDTVVGEEAGVVGSAGGSGFVADNVHDDAGGGAAVEQGAGETVPRFTDALLAKDGEACAVGADAEMARRQGALFTE